MMRFIAITIFILGEMLYNKFCPGVILSYNGDGISITNWSIIYFSCTYVCTTLICIDGILNDYHKFLIVYYIICSILFISLIVCEVYNFGNNYNAYQHSVGAKLHNIILHTLFMLSILFIALVLFYKSLNNLLCPRQ